MNHLTMASDAEAADLREPPASVSHLLVADDALAQGRRTGTYIAVCGTLVRASSRPSACCSLECECDCECDCSLYCPECVREAGRWSAPLPTPAGQPDPGAQTGEEHDGQP